MIHFYVFNYSKLDDAKINRYIDNLLKELEIQNVNLDYNTKVCEQRTKDRFQVFINSNEGQPLCGYQPFLFELNDYSYEVSEQKNMDNFKFIFLGEKLTTKNSWGDAYGRWLTVISYLHEKNIWHEVAHLLGAEDHYDSETKLPLAICTNPSECIMTYAKTKGVLCKEALAEIRNYIRTLED